MNALLDLANHHIEEITSIRRDIHAHPELGFEETRTAALVAKKLNEWGVEVTERIATTGVVGTIHGRRFGARAIGLRADMDALALCELNTLPHRSKIEGRMHACGHDGHTAMLLGAAQVLSENPDFEGTVHVIFQPAEEGRGGAKAMLQEDLFKRFPCDRVFGLHSHPSLPMGSFGIRKKEMMPASGRWEVKFLGAGGHGGQGPHLTSDLTVILAHFILALQTIVGRNVAPAQPAVISVGHISAGMPEMLSIMPSEVNVGGTMRAFDSDVQELLERRIRELAEAFAKTEGATCDVNYRWGTVPLINDPEATDNAVQAATAIVGEPSVNVDLELLTAAEDFSYLARHRPGAFMMLGNGWHAGDGGGNVHTPRYDFNDNALPYGIAYWLSVVNEELGGRLGKS